MKRIATTAVLFTLCVLGGSAMAAGHDTPPATAKPSTDHSQMDQGKMDHNDDRKAQQGKTSEFTALDTNKNGNLSKKELAKHKLAPHFGMLDANKDGRLSLAEFVAGKGM